MRYLFLFSVLLFATCQAPAQNTSVADYDKMLEDLLDFSVPTIRCDELKAMEDVYILDAREKEEFATSHLKDARHIGYNKLQKEALVDIPLDAPIVVYCTVGYRSEQITKKLMKKGYTNVSNLYGSIFSWVNEGNPVYNKSGETTKVHTYNKNWSKWLQKGEKIY